MDSRKLGGFNGEMFEDCRRKKEQKQKSRTSKNTQGNTWLLIQTLNTAFVTRKQ